MKGKKRHSGNKLVICVLGVKLSNDCLIGALFSGYDSVNCCW